MKGCLELSWNVKTSGSSRSVSISWPCNRFLIFVPSVWRESVTSFWPYSRKKLKPKNSKKSNHQNYLDIERHHVHLHLNQGSSTMIHRTLTAHLRAWNSSTVDQSGYGLKMFDEFEDPWPSSFETILPSTNFPKIYPDMKIIWTPMRVTKNKLRVMGIILGFQGIGRFRKRPLEAQW